MVAINRLEKDRKRVNKRRCFDELQDGWNK